jgi:hypothetical protein
VAGPCEHDNESSGSIKGGEFLDVVIVIIVIVIIIIIIVIISLITGCLFPGMSLKPALHPTSEASGFRL